VNEDQRAEEIRRLETLVAGPAGALAFPALAEAQRRVGRPDEAERVARAGLARAPHTTSGRVALALALLDQKRGDEARAELERLVGSDPEHAIAGEAVSAQAPEGVVAQAPEGGVARSGESGFTAAGAIDLEPVRPAGGEIATLDPYPEEPAPRPFGPPPPPAPAEPLVFNGGDVGDDELDDAFEAAESDREQMLGADDVARAALSAVPDEDDGEAELDPTPRVDLAEGEDVFVRPAGFAVPSEPEAAVGSHEDEVGVPGSPFATETIAGLLEQQGHAEEADRLRERLEPPESPPGVEAATPREPRDRGRQATLERWLENLRRDPS